MNAHKKTAAKFTSVAFGVVVLIISASTSFAFFYNYFSNLIPPGLLGTSVASLISGFVGTLLFDVASVVWLQTYLNDARTPEQRAISLIMLIVTFLGAAAASVAHLALSATGELALDAATLDSIATISLVAVIIGVIANFGSTIAYQRFSQENKEAVRESDRLDEIQKAEDEQALELDRQVAQKLRERLVDIAPSLAAQQAARIAAQYQRRESNKYGSAETNTSAPRETDVPATASPQGRYYFHTADNGEARWYHDLTDVRHHAKVEADTFAANVDYFDASGRKLGTAYAYERDRHITADGMNRALESKEGSTRPTPAPQPSRAQTNGHAAGFSYPKRDSNGYHPE